ncbi:MAG: glycosyltransferase family 2 protein [Nitrososphaeria archaeon]
MKQYPRISIVTPSYNQGKYLEQTICSVLEQNYPNLEYIVIDGGSTDNSVEIIKKYQKHLAYWVSERDKGQSHAINKGISVATGDLFNWLNSDDYLEKGALHAVARAYTENTTAICGFCRTFEDSNPSQSTCSRMTVHDFLEKTLVFRNIVQPSTFLNLRLVKDVGGVNEQLHYVMDFELWIKIILKEGTKNVKFLDSVLANYRLHSTSKGFCEIEHFREEEYALYLSILQQVLPDSVLIPHLKNLTPIRIDQRWEISEKISISNFDLEMKKRFLL